MVSFSSTNQLFCFVKCIILFALCQNISTSNVACVAPSKVPDVQIGKKLPVSTFLVLSKTGFQSCIKECEAYTNCLSVNFDRIQYTCELNEYKENGNHSLVDAGDFIYKETSDLDSHMGKRCGYVTCGHGTKCIRTKLNNRICMKIVHGVWEEWSTWTDCTVLCEGGVRNRTRHCRNLTPHIALNGCEGNHSEVLTCNPDNCTDRNIVRLVNGSNSWEGRLEVQLSGMWGTVCDDYWDLNDAHVVCRSLGFFGAKSAVLYAGFGEGVGQIWMDDVKCSGSEHSLFSCPQNSYGAHNCQHTEDAGVVCF